MNFVSSYNTGDGGRRGEERRGEERAGEERRRQRRRPQGAATERPFFFPTTPFSSPPFSSPPFTVAPTGRAGKEVTPGVDGAKGDPRAGTAVPQTTPQGAARAARADGRGGGGGGGGGPEPGKATRRETPTRHPRRAAARRTPSPDATHRAYWPRRETTPAAAGRGSRASGCGAATGPPPPHGERGATPGTHTGYSLNPQRAGSGDRERAGKETTPTGSAGDRTAAAPARGGGAGAP